MRGSRLGDLTVNRTVEAVSLDFDLRLMLQLRGSAITFDAGLLVRREVDEVARHRDRLRGLAFGRHCRRKAIKVGGRA